ncbi:conserved hypothetical protein [Histoplasma capsulatum G186AR]|uniref:Uncharacterized protein n=1 Tax=Ajellomyces capsulatus (strain G186AR / H82 / ATCC MYA-2454 / RMSCC 2432) TaxID=447093 RepID=C0NI54_AJECG|nr:uncharacterized protein HCBG_03026 [Histoplasma capsulatum G186AR]EEH09489.1 conserved hypothetical protein [Histoplasma capsulatum G186AR]
MAPSATTINSSAPRLSSNDSAVLQALFDAEASPRNASAGIHVDPSLPQQLPGISPTELSALQALERAAIIPLQADTEAEQIRDAVAKLTAIIETNKGYASAYVNRAQAARMLAERKNRDRNQNPQGNGRRVNDGSRDNEAADPYQEAEDDDDQELANMIFSDLSTAITLLTPSPVSNSSSASSSAPSQQSQHQPTSLSPLHARIIANAHTHRAYILYRASRALSTSTTSPPNTATAPLTLPRHLQHKSAQQLEEMASMDFQLGGRYGNDIARQLAIKTNPYAKMCGAIVKEAMRKEMIGAVGEGQWDGDGDGGRDGGVGGFVV